MATTKLRDSIDTIAGECIAVRMRLLNRVVTNIYDDALPGLGLKVSQMNMSRGNSQDRRGSPRRDLPAFAFGRVNLEPQRRADEITGLAGSDSGPGRSGPAVPSD